MRITLDSNMMKNLSFPDFSVEKMELSHEEKKLKIFVDGAWLNINGGYQLGKGVLSFNSWENLSINRFDPHIEKWSQVHELEFEPLKDICRVEFFDSTVCMYGFGRQIGHWMEWAIQNAKMCAEFDTYLQEIGEK